MLSNSYQNAIFHKHVITCQIDPIADDSRFAPGMGTRLLPLVRFRRCRCGVHVAGLGTWFDRAASGCAVPTLRDGIHQPAAGSRGDRPLLSQRLRSVSPSPCRRRTRGRPGGHAALGLGGTGPATFKKCRRCTAVAVLGSKACELRIRSSFPGTGKTHGFRMRGRGVPSPNGLVGLDSDRSRFQSGCG